MAIFPLPARPALSYKKGGREFGVLRNNDTILHPACDLIAVPDTEIYAVEAGTVMYGPRRFFESGPHSWVSVEGKPKKQRVCSSGAKCLWVHELVIAHKDFLVRYGEISPRIAPGIKKGESVNEGQLIAYVGHQTVATMLHFEMFSNTTDFSDLTVSGNMKYLNFKPQKTFNRRIDLMDPTDYLDLCVVKTNP